jgi:hypothetical protein
MGEQAVRRDPSTLRFTACQVGFIPRPLHKLHIAAEFTGCLSNANKGKIRSVGWKTP